MCALQHYKEQQELPFYIKFLLRLIAVDSTHAHCQVYFVAASYARTLSHHLLFFPQQLLQTQLSSQQDQVSIYACLMFASIIVNVANFSHPPAALHIVR